MSAIHRVDDIYAMDGPRFFTLAARLPAYPGVMQVRVQAELDKERGAPAPPAVEQPAPPNGTVPFETAGAHRGFKGDGVEFPPVFEQLGG